MTRWFMKSKIYTIVIWQKLRILCSYVNYKLEYSVMQFIIYLGTTNLIRYYLNSVPNMFALQLGSRTLNFIYGKYVRLCCCNWKPHQHRRERLCQYMCIESFVAESLPEWKKIYSVPKQMANIVYLFRKFT